MIDTRACANPDLYAPGEPQGEFDDANDPGMTSVLRGCVFGRIAGRHGAAQALFAPDVLSAD